MEHKTANFCIIWLGNFQIFRVFQFIYHFFQLNICMLDSFHDRLFGLNEDAFGFRYLYAARADFDDIFEIWI